MAFEDFFMPFQFVFMQKAFLIAFVLSFPTAILSCFLVIKGWSLMGDAISHAVLPGIVIAYIVGIPLIIGAFVAGMLCAWGTGFFSNNSRIKEDTIMGIIFSGLFGLGIVLFVAFDTTAHLEHILFGNILGIEKSDIFTALVITFIIVLFFIIFWRDLMLCSFDPIQAKALALPTGFLHYGLLATLALVVIATLKAVGLILAIGLFIIPGAIAFLLTKRLSLMLFISVFANICAMIIGLYLSFYIDSAPAPTIIIVLTGMFFLVFVRKNLIDKKNVNIFISGTK